MENNEKSYLMIAGTFLPAFLGIGLYSIATKKNISFKNSEFIILFAAFSSLGGFMSAKMIKKV